MHLFECIRLLSPALGKVMENVEVKCETCCFEGVEVSRMGTVRELKRAVEAAFDHLPKEGPDRVSW